MPDSKENFRERFLPKVIEIHIDGKFELWELERLNASESKMNVTYRLKRTGKYETGV